MWLLALRTLYEAEVAEATAIIDTFLQKSVGVADHDSFMKTLKEAKILGAGLKKIGKAININTKII